MGGNLQLVKEFYMSAILTEDFDDCEVLQDVLNDLGVDVSDIMEI